MITGVTLIRNGVKLGYPFELAIRSLCELCSEVLVNVDPGEDNTMQYVAGLQKRYPNINIVQSRWDMSNSGDGSELANQANLLLPLVKTPWVCYMQADEMIHQKDHFQLKEFLREMPESVSQVELYRTYFWENLRTRLLTDEIWLGRIFRTGTHKVGGDGMYLIRESGDVVRSAFWIYHYSRMGREDDVNKRLRNLDSLFHEPEVVKSFKPFNYIEDSKGKDIVPYHGSHPDGVEAYYRV